MLTSSYANMNAASPVLLPSQINALILDDSLFDRKHIRRLCRTTGLPIYLDEVDRLSLLPAMLDNDDYDLILLDFNLPEGDGFQAMDMVRRNPRNGHCPIVLVTGVDQSEVAARAIRLGCADYITKDRLSTEAVRNLVVRMLGETGQGVSEGAGRDEHLDALCDLVAREFSQALQVEVETIVAAMQALRARLAGTPAGADADLAQIEQQCLGLWAALTRPASSDSARPRKATALH